MDRSRAYLECSRRTGRRRPLSNRKEDPLCMRHPFRAARRDVWSAGIACLRMSVPLNDTLARGRCSITVNPSSTRQYYAVYETFEPLKRIGRIIWNNRFEFGRVDLPRKFSRKCVSFQRILERLAECNRRSSRCNLENFIYIRATEITIETNFTKILIRNLLDSKCTAPAERLTKSCDLKLLGEQPTLS